MTTSLYRSTTGNKQDCIQQQTTIFQPVFTTAARTILISYVQVPSLTELSPWC